MIGSIRIGIELDQDQGYEGFDDRFNFFHDELNHDRFDQVCDPILIRGKVDQDQGYDTFDEGFDQDRDRT